MRARTVSLGDVCEINPRFSGGVPDDERVSFLSMASVSEDGFVLREDERRLSDVRKGYTAFERGDILLAKITPCFENGKAARTSRLRNTVGFGSTEFHVLRAANDVSPDYIFHTVWTSAFRQVGMKNMTGSAGQKRVPADFLKSLMIPLPPLDEQRRIAAILDKADALRRQRRRALDLLDGLTQSIFLEMFGDADRNRFPVVEIGEVIAEGPSNGLYKPSSAYGVGTPILRINNFYDGAITSLDELRRLTLEESEIDRFELKEDDIVINRVNSREYVGKSAIVPALNERTVYESNMMRFSVRDDEALPTFVIQALQTSAVQRQIQSKRKDAINQSSINQKDVRSLRIVLPPIGEQRRFAQAVHFLAATRSVQRDGGGAHALFASLQHRAFNGQL